MGELLKKKNIFFYFFSSSATLVKGGGRGQSGLFETCEASKEDKQGEGEKDERRKEMFTFTHSQSLLSCLYCACTEHSTGASDYLAPSF